MYVDDLSALPVDKAKIDLNEKRIALLQAKQFQLRADYFKLRIENKLYVDRLGKVFNGAGVPFTIEQILDDEMAIMHRHIHHAQTYIDML